MIIVSVMLAAVMLLAACGNGGSTANTDVESSSDTVSEEPADNTNTLGAEVVFTVNTAITTRAEAVTFFVNKLAELSDGRIKGEVLEATVMGDEREITEAVSINTINCVFVTDPIIANVVGALDWLSLPGLFYTYDDVYATYRDGWVGETIDTTLEEKGLIRVGMLDNGFRAVAGVKAPLNTVDALKGSKVRTPESDPFVKWYEALGALPSILAVSEVSTALQQGTVDAIDNSPVNYVSSGIEDLVHYVTDTPYYNAGSIIINKDFWETLSAEDQEIFRQAGKETTDMFFEYFQNYTQELIDENVASGNWTISPADEKLTAAFKEASEKVWDYYAKNNGEAGAAIIEKLRESSAS